jgi:hypothetical protein
VHLEDVITIRRLVVGTLTTSVGAATSIAADINAAVASAEPAWLNVAIKFGTLGAAIVTILAGLVKVYLDIRKDLREQAREEAERKLDDISD